jgi:hypothetical protein
MGGVDVVFRVADVQVAVGRTPNRRQACRMGSGCGFLWAVVSPETITSKIVAMPMRSSSAR